jgi:hypothetical protein
MSTPTLDDFAAALSGSVQASLRRDPPRPDLADVIARARAIDEAAIPEGILATIGEHGDVDDGDEDDRPDAGLASFAAAMRVQVERGVRDRELAPVPAAPRAGRRRAIVAGAALAVAAAMLLALGWSRLGPTVLDPSDERDPMGAAGAAVDTEDGARPYEDARTPALEPAPMSVPEIEPEPETGTGTTGAIEPSSEPAPATAKRAKEAVSLDELEARARERWAAGDLDGAEVLFRRVARRAGKSSRAELAYGDLFAIAKQRGGPAALAESWREYLRRFPRGRYSDDARAGLCRRAGDDTQAACWSDYLKAHPQGAHASEARRLGSASGSP